MKKLLTLLLVSVVCITTCLFVACGSNDENKEGGNENPNPPTPPAYVEPDLAYGVSFANTAWADSAEKTEIFVCADSEARIYTNTDTNEEIVNGLKFKQVFDAEDYAEITANDIVIGALICPVNEIKQALEFDDNDKIVNIKLYEKASGTVKVNAFTQNGDAYELACHVRDFPTDGKKNTLDLACVFYTEAGEEVSYADRIDSTYEVGALNSINKGANLKATTVTALENILDNTTYTVTFDANGGSEVPALKVFKDSLLAQDVKGIVSTKTDLLLAKWQVVKIEDEEEVLVDIGETKVKDNVTLRAFFINPKISTAEEFYNALTTGAGDYYLANDIDMYEFMEEHAWGGGDMTDVNAPTCYIPNIFSGTIDGKNHKITGIHGESGANGNYGFIRVMAGKITNCYFEITAGFTDWQGTYGSHSFGTLANYLLGEVSNCVFNIVCYKDCAGSNYHRSQGLFGYLDANAVLNNVLVIDNSTDPYMEFRSLITGFAGADATASYMPTNVENVVFIRTHLGITVDYPAFMNGFYSYLPPVKSTGIHGLYLCGSFEDAITENKAYTLSDEFYNEENIEPNAEEYWEISANKAMDCLSGITYVDGAVSLNGNVVYKEYTAITTAEEFDAAMAEGTGKYKLANDITITKTGMTTDQLYQKTFSGVLDGNGKTLTISMTTDQCFFDSMFKEITGTIKNIKMVMTMDTEMSYSHFYAMLAQTVSGTVENCIFIGNYDSAIGGDGNYGLINSLTGNVKNCVIYSNMGLARAVAKTIDDNASIDKIVYVAEYSSAASGTYVDMFTEYKNTTNFVYIVSFDKSSSKGDVYSTSWGASENIASSYVTGYTFTDTDVNFTTAE